MTVRDRTCTNLHQRVTRCLRMHLFPSRGRNRGGPLGIPQPDDPTGGSADFTSIGCFRSLFLVMGGLCHRFLSATGSKAEGLFSHARRKRVGGFACVLRITLLQQKDTRSACLGTLFRCVFFMLMLGAQTVPSFCVPKKTYCV